MMCAVEKAKELFNAWQQIIFFHRICLFETPPHISGEGDTPGPQTSKVQLVQSAPQCSAGKIKGSLQQD